MGNLHTCICCHDDHWFLRETIRAVKGAAPVTVFISRIAWNGTAGDWQKCADIAEAEGAEVVLGDWSNESDHRRFAFAELARRGCEYVLVPDGDEIIEPALLAALVKIAKAKLADRVYVQMETYWKDAGHVIRPREKLTPLIMLNLKKVEHVYIREYKGGKGITLDDNFGVLHHLSYAGPNERIKRKIETWSHRHELQPQWFENIWLGWDANPLLRNLHPTHPPAYGQIERIEVPEILRGVEYSRSSSALATPKNWPSVSVIIPLYGGPEDLNLCLASLATCQELWKEVLVVDDKSPDDAPERVADYPFARLIENEQNLGFARVA